jgi:hypothetical protein
MLNWFQHPLIDMVDPESLPAGFAATKRLSKGDAGRCSNTE